MDIILGKSRKTKKYLLKKYNIPNSVPVCNLQLLEGNSPIPVVRFQDGKPAYIEILQDKSELNKLVISKDEFIHFKTMEEAIRYFLYGRQKITSIRNFNDAKIFIINFRDYAIPHPVNKGHYLFKYIATTESKGYTISTKYVIEVNEIDEWSYEGQKINDPVHFVFENRKIINDSLKNLNSGN